MLPLAPTIDVDSTSSHSDLNPETPLTTSTLSDDAEPGVNVRSECIYAPPCAPSLDIQLGMDFSQTDWNLEYARMPRHAEPKICDTSLDLVLNRHRSSRALIGRSLSHFSIQESSTSSYKAIFQPPVHDYGTPSDLPRDYDSHYDSNALSGGFISDASANHVGRSNSSIGQYVASTYSEISPNFHSQVSFSSLEKYDYDRRTPTQAYIAASPVSGSPRAHFLTPSSVHTFSKTASSWCPDDSTSHAFKTPGYRADMHINSQLSPYSSSIDQSSFENVNGSCVNNREAFNESCSDLISTDSSEFWNGSKERQQYPVSWPFLSTAPADDCDLATDSLYSALPLPSATSFLSLLDPDWTFDERIAIVLLSARLDRCREESESCMKCHMPINRLAATRLAVTRLAATLSDKTINIAKNCFTKVSQWSPRIRP